jgi:hypothetical protein
MMIGHLGKIYISLVRSFTKDGTISITEMMELKSQLIIATDSTAQHKVPVESQSSSCTVLKQLMMKVIVTLAHQKFLWVTHS